MAEEKSSPAMEEMLTRLASMRLLTETSFDHPVCPCEEEEVGMVTSYDVPQPWIMYDGEEDESLYKEAAAVAFALTSQNDREYRQLSVNISDVAARFETTNHLDSHTPADFTVELHKQTESVRKEQVTASED